MTPMRECIDFWFGHPDFAGEPDQDIAPRLEACPACGFDLSNRRPTFTCPECGQVLTERNRQMSTTTEKNTISIWVYSTPSEPGTAEQSERDRLITDAVGRESVGGGFDFQTGERDMSFEFGLDETLALGQALIKLTKLPTGDGFAVRAEVI